MEFKKNDLVILIIPKNKGGRILFMSEMEEVAYKPLRLQRGGHNPQLEGWFVQKEWLVYATPLDIYLLMGKKGDYEI